MSKYAGIIAGAIAVILGLAGLMGWWDSFIALLKGTVPMMMIFAGSIAVIAGLSEMKDEAAAKKEEKK